MERNLTAAEIVEQAMWVRRRIGDAGQRRHGEAFNIECYVLRLAEIWRQAAATRNTARPG